MRIRKCLFTTWYRYLLILVTFIRITMALTSAVTNDNHQHEMERRTTSFSRNIADLEFITGELTGNKRHVEARDFQAQARIRNTRSALQDQDVIAKDINSHPTSIRTATTTSHQSGSQQKCMPLYGTAQVPLVTLLRISPQYLVSSGSVAPFTFSVDSTISRIIVKVNGTNPMDATIWNPAGAMINKRVRREAVFARNNDQRMTYSFRSVSENNIAKVSRERPIHLQKRHLRQRRQIIQKMDIPQQRSYINKYPYCHGEKANMTDYVKMNRIGSRRQRSYHKFFNYKVRNRLRRSSSLMSLVQHGSAATWEMEPPETGIWAITVDGPEPVQIVVTALSSLNFKFQFLDIRTMNGSMSQPVAYDTTLARLTLTSLGCIGNVTLFNLYNDAGETIAVVESDNVGVNVQQTNSDGKMSLLVWFQMPDVPFYMSVTGYDIMGIKFQRLCTERVVPRIFALSFVNFRTDPLVPGNNYKFGVRLRNRGRPDTFKIVGSWDNDDYFTVNILPGVLKVDQNQISHVTVVVNIKPAIYFFMKGLLTITAIRKSDNVTDTLSEVVTAEPRRFLQDYESPICTNISTTGGCRLNIDCQSQKWAQSVSVIDSLTGVRSAVFMNPPPGAFNNVQFSYSMTNRTARADYRFTCCNMEVTLLVYDYASNPSYCKLVAQILELPTSGPLHSNSTSFSNNNAVTAGHSNSFTDNRTTRKYAGSSRSLESSLTWKRLTLPPLPQYTTALGDVSAETNNGNITFRMSVPWQVGTSRSTHYLATGESNFMMTTNNSTIQRQQKWNPSTSTTLRLAAIICGSIAGTAGLAIAVICVIYRCDIKRRQSHLSRRRSNGSDMTMGSSSESRSEGSSTNSSLKRSNVDARSERLSNDCETYKIPEKSGRIYDISKNIPMTSDGKKSIQVADHSVTHVHKSTDIDHRPFTEIKDEQTDSPKRKEVEDVTFRCVILKVTEDQKDDKMNEYLTDGPGEGGKKISYSPMLRAGGRTYTNMLQVQRQMDEMDKQRLSISHAARECDITDIPDNRLSNNPDIAASEGVSAGKRAKALRKVSSYYDSPLGSPQLRGNYKDSHHNNVESYHSAAALAANRENEASIRCQSGSSSSSSNVDKDTKHHIVQTIADKTVSAYYNRHQVSNDQATESIVSQQPVRASVVAQRSHKNLNSNNLNFADNTYNFLSTLQNQSVNTAENYSSFHGSRDVEKETKISHTGLLSRISNHTRNSLLNDSEDHIQKSTQIPQSEVSVMACNTSAERRANTEHRKRTKLYQQTRSIRAQKRLTQVNTQQLRTHVLGHRNEEDMPQASSAPNINSVSRNGEQKSVLSIQSSENNNCRIQGTPSVNYLNVSGDNFRDGGQVVDKVIHKAHADTPKNSKSNSSDLRGGHQTNEPDIITDANQMALRSDTEQIRQKLLKFQTRIDNQEIDVEIRRSREHSPCSSSNHSYNDND